LRPSARTTGENRKVTPYCLNSVPIWQTPTPVQLGAVGTGISPPTVSFALSPETAETVGSARMRATPFRSKACKVALKVLAGLCAVSAVGMAFGGYPMTLPAAPITPLIANGLNWVKVPHLAVS